MVGLQESLPTQSGEAAHNAVASLVNLYAGIIGDQKRNFQLVQSQLIVAQAAIKNKDAEIAELKAKLGV